MLHNSSLLKYVNKNIVKAKNTNLRFITTYLSRRKDTIIHTLRYNSNKYTILLTRRYKYKMYNDVSVYDLKPRSHLAKYFFRLFTIEINSAIANNIKPIEMMKMQCVTIYPNIYECVSDSI